MPDPDSDSVTGLDADALSRAIHARAVSCREVMQAYLDRIHRLNPRLNAIVNLAADDVLLAQADARDADLARGAGAVGSRGWLHGIPQAIKDTGHAIGFPTTYGCTLLKDAVAAQDSVMTARMKAAGCIVIGKTNMPELGLGSHTFNNLFGATPNAWDFAVSAGGSSGGAAVALACGMLPLADGSDTGGSLRNPASFNNVVGFRTAPGRVPVYPAGMGWGTLSVQGPLARTVQDTALLLSVLAGPDPRSPIAINEPGWLFSRPLGRDFRNVRIAWSRNLGRYPMQPAINEVCDQARPVFAAFGCQIEDDEPDFRDADEIFQVLRAWSFAQNRGEELKRYRAQIKDTIIWNTEQGLKLTGLDISRAETKRTQLFQRVRQFLERYEFLVLPVTQVAPFPVELDWVKEINGVKLETYIDWMATCYAITVTGLPAISVPCGFTKDGLPVGLQIVGRHQQDFAVLQLAHAFEQATQHGKTRPALAS